MSTRYPHKWLPGYTARNGEVTGRRTSPDGTGLQICQRCGAETPVYGIDVDGSDCPGAKIQEQVSQWPTGPVRITDVAARAMHRLLSYTPAIYEGNMRLMLSYAVKDPAGWTEQVLRTLNLLHPEDYRPLRDELEALTAMTGRPWQEFDRRSIEVDTAESGVAQ